VNAAQSGAATAKCAVRNDGRVATITGDPPARKRGMTVTDVYVKADGARPWAGTRARRSYPAGLPWNVSALRL
jgi:hypothetical protein